MSFLYFFSPLYQYKVEKIYDITRLLLAKVKKHFRVAQSRHICTSVIFHVSKQHRLQGLQAKLNNLSSIHEIGPTYIQYLE